MLAMDHIEAPVLAALPLPMNARVVIAGAYKGDTAMFMLEHFPDAQIVAYEPQEWAMAQIPNDPRIEKRMVALSTDMGLARVHSFGTDACSMMPVIDETNSTNEQATVPTSDAVAELEGVLTSLLILNIEGYEYTLLPYLLDNYAMPVRLMVQYHHYKTHEVERFEALRERLRLLYTGEREIGKGWFYYA